MVRTRSASITRTILGLLALAACASITLAAPPNVRLVRTGAPVGGDGLSWATAYSSLRTALSTAESSGGAITELWVAQGSYVPSAPAGTDPTLNFTLLPGVALYGGFAGTETTRDQRDPAAHVTTLDGAGASVRAYNVVLAAGNPSTILDGFTIRNGRASQPGSSGTGWAGGGIHITGTPTIRNCTVTACVAVRPDSEDTVFRKGGGVYCAPGSAATLIDCRITGNAVGQAFMVSGGAGGGLAAETCLVRLVRCTVSSNRSGNSGWGPCTAGVPAGGFDGGPGGGVYFGASVAALEQCTFASNTTGVAETPGVCVTPPLTADCKDGGDGGAIYSQDSFIAATNCLFLNNTTAKGSDGQEGGSNPSAGGDGGDGAAVWTSGGSVTFTNCTFFGNIPGAGGVGSLEFPTLGKPAGAQGIAGVGTVASAGPAARLQNCIVWNGGGIAQFTGPIEASYCDVQGGYAGPGNISADPRFMDGASGNYRLAADSPCIDAADSLVDINPFNPGTQPIPPVDADGLDRLVNVPGVADTGLGSPPVDMGAFEVQHTCTVDYTGDGLVDFSDYLIFLNLFDAQDLTVDFTQDGLVDFSDYLEFLNLFEAGC